MAPERVKMGAIRVSWGTERIETTTIKWGRSWSEQGRANREERIWDWTSGTCIDKIGAAEKRPGSDKLIRDKRTIVNWQYWLISETPVCGSL
jgi:hypothetical protein